MPPTVCLNMIVKNEAGVIRRCLDSVRPFIQNWAIVDTGSTDGTQAIIREHFAGVPGELHERPWKNFGHNRSEALALARGKADYILVIDADEELVGEPGFVLPSGADTYMVLYSFADSPVTWHRATFIKASLPWRYEGVLHEYLECGQPPDRKIVDKLRIVSHTDGARNSDPRKKYENDAKILEQGLRDEPDNARYVFYLAQSYRDAQNLEKAIENYERRVKIGGWEEEVYYSLFQIAVLKQRAKHDGASIVAAYLRAHAFRPSRAESLVELAAYFRATQEWPLGELYARSAVAIPPSSDILFVDTSAAAWRALDELAIATYYTQKYEESAELNRRLLASPGLPVAQRARIQQNLDFCLERLGRSGGVPKSAESRASASGDGARIQYRACPLCAATDLVEERIGDASKHPLYVPELPSKIRWVRCRACEHVFTDGYFSPRALELLFARANASQRPGADIHGARALSAKMVEKVRAILGSSRGRWLDVGFGNGALLTTASEYGFGAVGLDLRRENVEALARFGIEAEAREFTEYRPSAPLSVISMADVLEHMILPKDALRHAHSVLADDGVLFLSMPNSDCFAWKFLDEKGENPYWHELEHYHNFGRRRLEALLEECGFTAVAYGISERYHLCMEVLAKKKT